MTFVDDPNFPRIKTSKVGFQIMKCLGCGNSTTWAIDSKLPNGEYKTPWDVWPKGCPKCGGGKVDVDMVF